MKKFLLILTICLSILFIKQVSFAEIKDSQGYISLSGSMEKEVDPNIAKLSFSIVTTDKDVKKATEENNIITNRILTALKSITKEGQDTIKTSNFSVNQNYEYNNEKRTLTGYSTNNSIVIETKDIKSVSKLINTVLSNGANEFNGISFSYTNNQSACNDMYPMVLKEMRSQADIIAKAAGTSVAGIKQINVSCGSNISYARSHYDLAYSAKAVSTEDSTPIEAGKSKISLRINADFYVK